MRNENDHIVIKAITEELSSSEAQKFSNILFEKRIRNNYSELNAAWEMCGYIRFNCPEFDVDEEWNNFIDSNQKREEQKSTFLQKLTHKFTIRF